MEFIQFHPTALRLPGVPIFLISEAVRGEGGILRNAAGERFMPPLPREGRSWRRATSSRARSSAEMQRTARRTSVVSSTSRTSPPTRITARFPQIYRYCLDHGVDITKAARPRLARRALHDGRRPHEHLGRDHAPGLYACGECACTGVHGANRLASNSLLETVVFAKRIVERITRPDRTDEA